MSHRRPRTRATPTPPLLLVENSQSRVDQLLVWCPEEFRLVVVASGNAAMGMLRRDAPDTYAGIMLDFDLDRVPGVPDERCGMDVAQVIVERVNRATPILVHSMNATGSAIAADRLRSVGFDVTKIPYTSLAMEEFLEWLEECAE